MSSPSDKHMQVALAIVGVGWGRDMQGVKSTLCTNIASALATAEQEGMRRAAEIARGSSGEYDFQVALAEGRDFDYGFHNGKNHAADSILATIIIDNSNSPDTLPVEADSASGAVSSSPASLATYSPWTVKNGFNPDKVKS